MTAGFQDPRPAPTTGYQQAFHALLDDLFAFFPTWATDQGYHRYDDRWPDLSERAREERIAALRRHRQAIAALAPGALGPGEDVDRGICLDTVDSFLFADEVLREEAWDASLYLRVLGDGLFQLLGREFAPLPQRLRALLARARAIPAVLAVARENLVGLPDRPVSLLHLETALDQIDGVDELIGQAVDQAAEGGEDPELSGLRSELGAVRPEVAAAMDGFRSFLSDELRPRAEGEGRLGRQLFAAKLRHTLSEDVTPEALEERAQRDYERVREEMVRLARELWETWRPGEPAPDAASDGSTDAADQRAVREVLDAIGQEHRQPDELLSHCQALVRELEGFCRERELVGLPDEPLAITWTPTFLRPFGGAWLSPPGPLDKGLQSYFWITPPGDDWPPERVESYLREDNDRMLHLLCIHEATPGHYLQLAWSNRTPSLTRSLFSSGLFAEGWAVYVTQVMMDVGYRADDGALLLVHWKFFLRAVINTLIDIRIHARGMTEQEAIRIMVEGGFQEEQEARAKYLRARLTSTQLCTYYVGSLGMWDVEVEARRRAAGAAGAIADGIPEQRVVGGFGETPGFDRRTHLEAVLSHGTPPIPWLKRILFGEPPGSSTPSAAVGASRAE